MEGDLGEIRNKGPLLNHPSNSQVSSAQLSGISSRGIILGWRKRAAKEINPYTELLSIFILAKGTIHVMNSLTRPVPTPKSLKFLTVVCNVGMHQISGKEV